MEDEKIVQLFRDRDEQAIKEATEKYGAYCSVIAGNILSDRADVEECVNDTWLKTWNSIPPNKPEKLSAYLGKITRNLAFDRYKKNHREKRGGMGIDLILDELSEVLSDSQNPEKTYTAKELGKEINTFLKSLSKEKRYMFIRRYWYAENIKSIAEQFKTSENNISVCLNRIRNKLKAYLKERGYDI